MSGRRSSRERKRPELFGKPVGFEDAVDDGSSDEGGDDWEAPVASKAAVPAKKKKKAAAAAAAASSSSAKKRPAASPAGRASGSWQLLAILRCALTTVWTHQPCILNSALQPRQGFASSPRASVVGVNRINKSMVPTTLLRSPQSNSEVEDGAIELGSSPFFPNWVRPQRGLPRQLLRSRVRKWGGSGLR